MKLHRIGCALVLVIASAAVGQQANDAKLLEGTWLPTAAELGGNPFDEKTLKSMKLVVKGQNYIVTVGEAVDKGSVKINADAKPKTMDIMGSDGPNKDKTFLAIYEFKDGNLRVCYDLTGKARPTEFKTEKGKLVFLATYQRAKP